MIYKSHLENSSCRNPHSHASNLALLHLHQLAIRLSEFALRIFRGMNHRTPNMECTLSLPLKAL